MKDNHKFLRVVLGAVVGAAFWAGCTTERHEVVYEPAGASYDRAPEPTLDPQADMVNWHTDTHPEWRTGWNMAFPLPPSGTDDADRLHNAVEQPSLAPPESR